MLPSYNYGGVGFRQSKKDKKQPYLLTGTLNFVIFLFDIAVAAEFACFSLLWCL